MNYCNICSTVFCYHTMQGMTSQQQMSNQLAQHYNKLIGVGHITPSPTQKTHDHVPEEKKSNKLLLLLR